MQPSVISAAREEIDDIDRQMAELFEKRMAVVLEIAKYKQANGIAVFDGERERAIISKRSKSLYYRDFLKGVMSVSKACQNDFLASCSNKKSIFVKTKLGGYKVKIERDAIKSIADEIDLNKKVLIVTDDGVPKEYIDTILGQCEHCGVFEISQGESSKNPQCLFDILACLSINNYTRKDLVIALGGGVVGDLAGLAASLFMRGIDFLNIPTTTLSQIDSSIGGKTAIDFCKIKNNVGTFYQPTAVIIDANLLETLPKRDYNNGLIEALKAGLIYDKDLFELFCFAQKNRQSLNIDEIIYRSLLVKKAIIEQDENEIGIRKILNFGHTLGHALEALSQKTTPLLHGEAVALGMLRMIDNEADSAKVREILDYLSMPDMPKLTAQKAKQVDELILHDKKSNGKYIETVRIKSVGEAYIKKVEIGDIKTIYKT